MISHCTGDVGKRMRSFGRRSAALTAAFALMVGGFAGQTAAGCGDRVPSISPQAPGLAHLALYRPDDPGRLVSVYDAWTESAPIVGLWEFEFHLKGAQNGLPDGALFDWGLATWHSDGSEIQFSAGRPPVAGDVCMGVWHMVGPNTFQLHHIALGLTPPDASGMFVGPAIIRATVTVNAAGNSYSGPYSVTIYPGSPDDGTEFNESGAPLVGFTGTITAKRVLPD